MEKKKEDEQMPVAAKFILFILLIAIVCFLYGWYQSNRYGNFSAYWNYKKSDCAIDLPNDIWIASNGIEYVVKIKYYTGERYLWARGSGFIDWAFNPWTTFSDSCKAKAFALEYLRDKEADANRNNSFK